ncbi:MAG: primase-helicase family protein [Prevotella sp.]|jgi:hypothetical protein
MSENLVPQYIRVRTDYYKIVQKPTTAGDHMQVLIKWKLGTIRKDEGKEVAEAVPHYDDFIVFPDNLSTHQVVDNRFWNLYHPMKYKPEKGEFPNIDKLVSHIFGEQKELGYDYLQLLYLKPLQKLPVLLLVSKERNTGKSTFMHFLRLWFGDNVTFNTNEDFNSQFNADWAGVLLICVDETMLSKRESSERIKNLSTSPIYKIEAKGKDKVQQEFFAKFVFCSNNVEKPLIIDPGETRFWVREVPKLESDDVNFLSKIEGEIPHLMYYLKNERQLSVPKSSRMYFDPKDLKTDALLRIMMNSRSQMEATVYELCSDLMASMLIDEFSFVSGDLRGMLSAKGIKSDDSGIRHVLKDLWHLQPRPTPSTYQQYTYGIGIMGGYQVSNMSAKGRYYTISRDFLRNLYGNCRFVDEEDETGDNQEDTELQDSNECPF